MKRAACFLFFLITLLSACSKVDNGPKSKEEKVRIDFSTMLEGVSITSEEISTRAGDDIKNLYQVQIWYYPQGSIYKTPFAYGLFDDLSKATFEVIKGYTYSVAVSVYTNGANVLATFGQFVRGSSFSSIGNTPVYESSKELDISTSAGVSLKGSSLSSHPKIEWFYGISADMEINNATTVSIDCKRINFAIKVIVNNLTKGSVLLENSSLGNETIYPENPIYESIYAFYSAELVLKEGFDRGLGYPTKFYYVREDGMKELLYTLEEYVLRRNQKTVVTLNLKSQETSDKANASFSVSLDSSTFTEDPIVVTQE